MTSNEGGRGEDKFESVGGGSPGIREEIVGLFGILLPLVDSEASMPLGGKAAFLVDRSPATLVGKVGRVYCFCDGSGLLLSMLGINLGRGSDRGGFVGGDIDVDDLGETVF